MNTSRTRALRKTKRTADKPLVPLEPRGVWHRPYMPGDCPISREQLAQHTYIEQERDEAIRMFLQKPKPPEIVHIREQYGLAEGLVVSAIAASLIVGWGWAMVVVIRWVGALLER